VPENPGSLARAGNLGHRPAVEEETAGRAAGGQRRGPDDAGRGVGGGAVAGVVTAFGVGGDRAGVDGVDEDPGAAQFSGEGRGEGVEGVLGQ
jgi:hypothetical protein